MSTKFFTNAETNTLINKMEGVLKSNNMINCFDAVVGYLRASGYFQIRECVRINTFFSDCSIFG